MIDLLRSFYDWTLVIDRIRKTIIHLIFVTYNTLFDHLKDQRTKQCSFDVSWFKKLNEAITKVTAKLSKYYSLIEDNRDTLYNIDVLLDSSQKLRFCEVNILTNFSHERDVFIC
jgi:hypothetical protein